uniref:Uncharacterized protein n=1 Tax=Haptolina brevifila TaxID=156173 RepID=A0A7S2IUB4_9EUKA|mmetsp:Transcript_71259/g.141289  ORF Transcript_71259/g.141289 Transcript_71259/m.141289 type:complete len:158 (+) Transcript_71259:81-554(+)
MKNCCVRLCSPFALFCEPITKLCGLSAGDALDLKLDGQNWKASFGKASGIGHFCLASPVAFTAVRGLLLVYWIAVMIWSMWDWVNSTAYPVANGTQADGSCPQTFVCGDGSLGNQTSAACEFMCTIDYQYGFWWTQLTHWTLILELMYLTFAFVTTV